MKKLTVFCICILFLSALIIVFPTAEENRIYDNILRLHVIAESDSEYDTAVKLIVRDAVLNEVTDIYGSAPPRDAETAESILRDNLKRIENAAYATATDYRAESVSVSLDRERFPEKTYGDITLPAGTYSSLVVKIGKAEGHNWWCVVFPAVCTSAAVESPSAVMMQTGFSREQINILRDDGKSTKYKIKFKLLELFSDIFA